MTRPSEQVAGPLRYLIELLAIGRSRFGDSATADDFRRAWSSTPRRVALAVPAEGELMGKVLYSATMSLDGYIAGPDGDMSWLAPFLGPNPQVDALQRDIGALLVGHRTFR